MNWQETHRGSLYFSVGYGMQWHSSSTININQGSLNNNYKLNGMEGNQDDGTGLFKKILPTYTIGYLFDYNQKMGVEMHRNGDFIFVLIHFNNSTRQRIFNSF